MTFRLNRAELLGHLGRDPDIRSLQNGNRVATMSVATDESFRNQSTNEIVKRTEWHTVVVYDSHLVEDVANLGARGKKVFVSGRLRTRKWQARDGSDRYTTEVIVTRDGIVEFTERAANDQAPPPNDQAPPPALANDEDLPV